MFWFLFLCTGRPRCLCTAAIRYRELKPRKGFALYGQSYCFHGRDDHEGCVFQPFAEDCFRRWHHPVTLHFAAKHQVAQVLQEGKHSHSFLLSSGYRILQDNMCARLCVHSYRHIYVHNHMYPQVCAHTHTCPPMHTQTHTHTHARTHACTHARTHARTHTHTHTHACTHTHTHSWRYTCMEFFFSWPCRLIPFNCN